MATARGTHAEGRGLQGQPQARGADMARGRTEGASEPTQALPNMAERRLMRPHAGGVLEPCLELVQQMGTDHQGLAFQGSIYLRVNADVQ